MRFGKEIFRRLFYVNGRLNTSFIVNRSYAASAKDAPVKFSSSNAKKWDSMDTFYPERARRQPMSQPFIVIGSVVVFLIYFCVLREPNEIDEMLERPLEQNVPNVKEMTLRHQILQYEQMGLDTRALKEALKKELEAKKAL